MRRFPCIRNVKNIKFVKSAHTQEERKLSVKDNDLEGIKYMFFTNTKGTSHVSTTDMIGTSQNEKEADIYKVLATEIPWHNKIPRKSLQPNRLSMRTM